MALSSTMPTVVDLVSTIGDDAVTSTFSVMPPTCIASGTSID